MWKERRHDERATHFLLGTLDWQLVGLGGGVRGGEHRKETVMQLSDLWTVVMRATGMPVLPVDCNPESDDEGMLVYRSRRAADTAAEHQSDMYGLDCEARRLDKVTTGEVG
jgi:hypothetical protein